MRHESNPDKWTNSAESFSSTSFALYRAASHFSVDRIRRATVLDERALETLRGIVRALVKRMLRKYGYPPDKQEKATQTASEQAALLLAEWAVT